MDPFLGGVAAGLAVAVPLGAIGVLLINEGVQNGRRSAAMAALGVATVDLAYSALAVHVGSYVASLLSGRERAVEVLAGSVLAAIALHGLWSLRPSPEQLRTDVPGEVGGAETGGATGQSGARARSAFVRFVGLTAINPLTALYFVALAAGLGDSVSGGTAKAAFAAGVFVGSLSWQLVLGLGGAALGAKAGPRMRRATGAVGYCVVLVLAGALAL